MLTHVCKTQLQGYKHTCSLHVSLHRYYAGVGLTCLVLIPVVLMAVGLLCGIFGHDKHASPTERGGISNMGGNCLMA